MELEWRNHDSRFWKTFWAKVMRPWGYECWIWLGETNTQGVGVLKAHRSQYLRAHRVAYYLSGRDIPEDHVVYHTCWHSDCVNPRHMATATRLEYTKIRKEKRETPHFVFKHKPGSNFKTEDQAS